jgi:Ca-activated chloride channel homolog
MRRQVPRWLSAGITAGATTLVIPAILAGHAAIRQAPTFRAETRLVVLHATVRNRRGEVVTDLERNRFTVFENGRPQPIALFRRDDIPVSLGLVIDNSGSMRSRRARVEAAAMALARASNQQDETFVLNFADKVRVDVPFTSDVQMLEAGMTRLDSIGGTALRDALVAAERYMRQHGTRDRKVLVVITDGNDNASMASLAQVRAQMELSDTVVYAMGLVNTTDPSKANRARHELDDLTERTGGLAYYPSTLDDIDAVALDLARQIRADYTIAYAPLNQVLDGSYRTLRVTVSGPDRLVVRTRAGYRATPGAAAAGTRPVPFNPH